MLGAHASAETASRTEDVDDEACMIYANGVNHTAVEKAICGIMVLVVVTAILGCGCADKAETSATPAGGAGRWTQIEFVGSYTFSGLVLEGEDLSGIACASSTQCLLGADEGRSVQAIKLSRSDKTLTVERTIELLASGDEIDIEAIAAEGEFYYIIGSHGVAKITGAVQGNRYGLFRLRVDPATGLPTEGPDSMAISSLSGILASDPTLGPYYAKPLQQHGVNIEGLAIRDGMLFVGLRNPNLDGDAFVIEVAADDLFGGAQRPHYTLHRLHLGTGLGIREMVAAQTGFLIIAGNAGSDPSDAFPDSIDYAKGRGFFMFYWPGPNLDVTEIGPIPNAPAKAEAMTILDESDDHITVLILFDSAPDGRPSVYRIS